MHFIFLVAQTNFYESIFNLRYVTFCLFNRELGTYLHFEIYLWYQSTGFMDITAINYVCGSVSIHTNQSILVSKLTDPPIYIQYLHDNALSVDCCTKEHKLSLISVIVTTQIASLHFFLHSLAAALDDLQNWVAIRQISFKLWITSPHEVCTLGGIPLRKKPLTHFQPQLCMQNNLCPETSKCLLGIMKEGNKVLLLCMNYAGKWHLISPVKPTTHLFVQRLTWDHNEDNIYSPFGKGIHWWLMDIPSQRTSY